MLPEKLLFIDKGDHIMNDGECSEAKLTSIIQTNNKKRSREFFSVAYIFYVGLNRNICKCSV